MGIVRMLSPVAESIAIAIAGKIGKPTDWVRHYNYGKLISYHPEGLG
jgi:hypothetical protein